ncbi:TPA: hypothetical protein ACXE8V_001613 [Pluralibacter gergoviae]
MKNRLLVLMLALISLQANAGRITLILSDKQETDNARICIYSNANFTETVEVRLSEQCKYTRTFEEE